MKLSFKEFYNLITEHKKSRGAKKLRDIWYHGTSALYLNDILKNGLITNPEKRSWDTDPDVGFNSFDRTSYGGIYLTKKLGTSISSANRTARKSDSNSIIVICYIQPKTLLADEDDVVTGSLKINDSFQVLAFLYKIYKYGTNYEDNKESYIAIRDNWVKNQLYHFNYMLGDLLTPKLTELLKEFLENDLWNAALTRYVSYINDYDWNREWRDTEAPPLPTQKEGEEKFRSSINRLTNLLKRFTISNKFITLGRSMQNIGYRGSNRIICIVEMNKKGNDLKTHYGNPPLEFLKKYREFHGKFTIDGKEYNG